MRNMIFLSLTSLITFACKPRFFNNPTAAMEATIKKGQKIYVEPTTTFKHNDIAVFDYLGEDYGSPPDDMGRYRLKEQKRTYRIIAISGDNFAIRNGEIYINNILLPPPPLAKTEYEIDSKVDLPEIVAIDPDQISVNPNGDTLKYIAPLTKEEANHYAQNRSIIFKIEKHIQQPTPFDTLYARASASGTWTMDDYGPLKIPSPGDSVLVNEINYKLYHNIPGIHQGLNVLREKLYFVMGDNRHWAQDSRFIGLISQSKMYGIVIE